MHNFLFDQASGTYNEALSSSGYKEKNRVQRTQKELHQEEKKKKKDHMVQSPVQ